MSKTCRLKPGTRECKATKLTFEVGGPWLQGKDLDPWIGAKGLNCLPLGKQPPQSSSVAKRSLRVEGFPGKRSKGIFMAGTTYKRTPSALANR